MEYLLNILPVIVVGVSLASLQIAQSRAHRAEQHKFEARTDARFDAISADLGALRERMAHLEGLFKGYTDKESTKGD